MGDVCKDALRVEFDSRIKLEFHGAAVTSDAGLIAYRELDEELGLTEIGEVFRDSRRGKNKQHELVGLLRQSVYSRLAGYEDTNDAERLAVDPAMRQVIGGRARDHQAASTSQMGRGAPARRIAAVGPVHALAIAITEAWRPDDELRTADPGRQDARDRRWRRPGRTLSHGVPRRPREPRSRMVHHPPASRPR